MVPETFPVDMMYHTDRFANFEPPMPPRDESHLVFMDNPFNVLLGPVSQDLVENFGVHIHWGYRSVTLLFDGVFVWFWYFWYFCSLLFSSSYWPLPLFTLLFLDPLGVRLGCLRFFLLLEVHLYGYKLPSQNHFCCIPKILDHCFLVFRC